MELELLRALTRLEGEFRPEPTVRPIGSGKLMDLTGQVFLTFSCLAMRLIDI